MAARDGLLATFMGKPFNEDEGSGFHLHISLGDEEGHNRCEDASDPSGLAAATRHFIAGVIEHCPAMMVFFNPTVNAYRRIHAEALVPTRACWGHDHRMTLVRVPRERGAGHAPGGSPRRRHRQRVPRLRRRARGRTGRHPPRPRAAGADRGLPL